jgi:hypothetical protein
MEVRWRSSLGIFSQIWLLPDMEYKSLVNPFIIFMATHYRPNIVIWGFLLFFIPTFFGNGNYGKSPHF